MARRLLTTVAILFGLLVVALWFLQRSMVFPRAAAAHDALDAPPSEAEVLWIDSPQGKVEAWYFRAGPQRAPLVIAAHGNAELIDGNVAIARRYNRLGLHALLVEFRGYGRSAGSPSEDAIVADFVAAHDRIAARPEVDPSRIVYHGRSLGGAVAIALAKRRAPAALVLQSTFTSIDDMAPRFAPSLLVRDHFDSLGVIRTLQCPVLIFHGSSDTIVPVAQGRALAEAARDARWVQLDCDHNDFPAEAETTWREIETFLRDNGVLSRD